MIFLVPGDILEIFEWKCDGVREEEEEEEWEREAREIVTWRDEEEPDQEYDQSGCACEQSGNPWNSLETKWWS